MEVKKVLLIFLCAVAIASPITLLLQHDASAADARNFNPGRIIDDGIFTNSDTMSIGDIQNFLNSKVSSCNAGYTCLRGYYENPANGASNYGGLVPAGAVSAAEIIYSYSKQFNINPQVLLVTLQKEKGLVTSRQPIRSQYTEAMGFGCPDNRLPGAPTCDPGYGSFSAQIYQGARHFRGYIDKPAGWFVPFTTGVNSIAYHPNASCGRGNVNIENRATVALYSYTTYQPNQAALNAQYATGDGCSSYGNRNFYLFFTDWFGSTTMNGTFLRTISNPTLYLVAGNTKYPIADINLMGALYPLGDVGYVSQSYLDAKTTGSLLGRAIRSNNGTVYFYDAGIKLSFGSCDQVASYGLSCGQSALLEDYQINSLVTGPGMTNLFGATSGKTFYINGATKKEIYDGASLTQAGIGGGVNMLNEAAIGYLPYGAPVVRDNVFVKNRANNSAHAYTSSNTASPVAASLQGTYLDKMNIPALDANSINAITKTADTTGYVQGSDSSKYIFTAGGKIKLLNAADWSDTFSTLPDALLSQIPTIANITSPYTVKSEGSNGTIYYVTGKKLRPITSWSGLLALNQNPNILTVPTYYLNNLTLGVPMLTPGSLVVTPDNPTVYAVDGLGNLVSMGSFDPAVELNYGPISSTTSDVISNYTKSVSILGAAVQCGSNQGLAIGGSVYPVVLTDASYTTLSTMNCSLLSWKSTAPQFLLANNGTIFQIQNGQKQPIASYGKYQSLGGNGTNTIRASNYVLNYFTNGTLIQ